jgi:hypothetical protein
MKPIVKHATTEKVYMVRLEDGNIYHAWHRKNKIHKSSRWQVEDAMTGIQINEDTEAFEKVKNAVLTS